MAEHLQGGCALCQPLLAIPAGECEKCRGPKGPVPYRSIAVHHTHEEVQSAEKGLSLHLPVMLELCLTCYQAEHRVAYPDLPVPFADGADNGPLPARPEPPDPAPAKNWWDVDQGGSIVVGCGF